MWPRSLIEGRRARRQTSIDWPQGPGVQVRPRDHRPTRRLFEHVQLRTRGRTRPAAFGDPLEGARAPQTYIGAGDALPVSARLEAREVARTRGERLQHRILLPVLPRDLDSKAWIAGSGAA